MKINFNSEITEVLVDVFKTQYYARAMKSSEFGSISETSVPYRACKCIFIVCFTSVSYSQLPLFHKCYTKRNSDCLKRICAKKEN